MDTQEIRRAAIVMALGYICITLYSFISLYTLPGCQAVRELDVAMYVGLALLTVGAFISDREHKYFKACFISFLCLSIIFLIFVIFGKSHRDVAQYDLIINIFTACLNAGLALSNGLFVNGVKEVFGKKKNKRMFAYSLVIEYGVTGVVLLSTIVSFIDFGSNSIAKLGVELALNIFIYMNYAVFMFIVFHTFKKQKKEKE